ncbi:MAG: hypothetical protein IIB36_14610 [Gemmatimonadetes bacterium]|nr:hypothetical protein [Gemmatimonadota bacterium]
MNVEVDAYRVAWLARTAEYAQGRTINVLSERPYKAWESALALRLAVEIPVTRGR